MAVTTCTPVRASTCVTRVSSSAASFLVSALNVVPCADRVRSTIPRRGGASQREHHISGARQRIVVIGVGLVKPQCGVERARFGHRVERIELELPIADVARMRDQRFGERATDAQSARGGTYVEALHF